MRRRGRGGGGGDELCYRMYVHTSEFGDAGEYTRYEALVLIRVVVHGG